MTDSTNLDWCSTLDGDIQEACGSMSTAGVGFVVYSVVMVGCGRAPSDSELK